MSTFYIFFFFWSIILIQALVLFGPSKAGSQHPDPLHSKPLQLQQMLLLPANCLVRLLSKSIFKLSLGFPFVFFLLNTAGTFPRLTCSLCFRRNRPGSKIRRHYPRKPTSRSRGLCAGDSGSTVEPFASGGCRISVTFWL